MTIEGTADKGTLREGGSILPEGQDAIPLEGLEARARAVFVAPSYESTRALIVDLLTALRAALSSKDEPLDVERLARARHRWQHPTFTLDLSPVEPGLSRRCGCRGWAETVREMLDLLDHDEQAAALSKETPA